ncbi:hypothetical protein ATO13_07540 [Stappia sp. 22II-S9-Z10]|nr:hypothetical protein ATO13_07540 [Stappia sp. 22II-S9-Z10]
MLSRAGISGVFGDAAGRSGGPGRSGEERIRAFATVRSSLRDRFVGVISVCAALGVAGRRRTPASRGAAFVLPPTIAEGVAAARAAAQT